MPIPPAFETLATNSGVVNPAIGAWTIGWRICKRLHNGVCSTLDDDDATSPTRLPYLASSQGVDRHNAAGVVWLPEDNARRIAGTCLVREMFLKECASRPFARGKRSTGIISHNPAIALRVAVSCVGYWRLPPVVVAKHLRLNGRIWVSRATELRIPPGPGLKSGSRVCCKAIDSDRSARCLNGTRSNPHCRPRLLTTLAKGF